MNNIMDNKHVLCEGCGFYKNKSFVFKHKNGRNYCNNCTLIVDRKPGSFATITEREFEKMLLAALKTPPLKLKDLKARLKKEREEKKKQNSKK
jgi:predicted dithiol-disulfide oxidoreductase (DUF899 family)